MARSADILKAERVCGRRFVRRRRAYNRSIQAPHIRGLGKDIARAFESVEAKEQAQLRGGKRATRKKGAFNVNVPSVPLPSWANLIPGVSNIKEYTAKNVQKCANDEERLEQVFKKLSAIDRRNFEIEHQIKKKFDEWVEGGEKGTPPKMPAFKKVPKSIAKRLDKAIAKERNNEHLKWMGENREQIHEKTHFIDDHLKAEEKRLRAGGKKKSRSNFFRYIWENVRSVLPEFIKRDHGFVVVMLRLFIAIFFVAAMAFAVYETFISENAIDKGQLLEDWKDWKIAKWIINGIYLFRAPADLLFRCLFSGSGLDGRPVTAKNWEDEKWVNQSCNTAMMRAKQEEANTSWWTWALSGTGLGSGLAGGIACYTMGGVAGLMTAGLGWGAALGVCSLGAGAVGGGAGYAAGSLYGDNVAANTMQQAKQQDEVWARTMLPMAWTFVSGFAAWTTIFSKSEAQEMDAKLDKTVRKFMSMTAPLRQYNQQRRQYQYMYNQQMSHTIGNAARAGLTVAGTLALGMPGGTIVNAAGKKVAVSLGHKLASYGMTDPISAMNTGVNTVGQAHDAYWKMKQMPHTAMFHKQFAANPQLQWMEAQKQKDMALFGDLRPTRTTYVLAVPGQPEVTYAQLDVAMAYATHPEAKIYEQKGNVRKCVVGCQQKQAAGIPARRPMPAKRAPPDALTRGSCPQGFAYNVHVGRCMPQDDIPTPPTSPRHRAPLPIATGY